MIEQTGCKKMNLFAPINSIETGALTSYISMDLMKKSTTEKKDWPAGLPRIYF